MYLSQIFNCIGLQLSKVDKVWAKYRSDFYIFKIRKSKLRLHESIILQDCINEIIV